MYGTRTFQQVDLSPLWKWRSDIMVSSYTRLHGPVRCSNVLSIIFKYKILLSYDIVKVMQFFLFIFEDVFKIYICFIL